MMVSLAGCGLVGVTSGSTFTWGLASALIFFTGSVVVALDFVGVCDGLAWRLRFRFLDSRRCFSLIALVCFARAEMSNH
jgi:hypothetical protein